MKHLLIAAICLLAGSVLLAAGPETLLMRFPDINGNLVVFVYGGDIWSVAAAGGVAHKLTSHEGLELFPKISPDGRWIAFSAEYSGSRQVYVIPAGGGAPRQLTYYNDAGIMPPRGGYDNVVLDWTPDSQRILIRANRTPWGERMGKYFLVSLAGGLETPLEIPEGGSGRFSPDGRQIVYTPIEREFRTWKRYKGGRAQDVWIFDLDKKKSRRLTDFPGTDQHPTWFGDKIYFVSDRDLTLNIYSYNLKDGAVSPVTNHREYDVLWPSGEGGQIAYENGGALYRLDLATGQSTKIPVQIASDLPARLPVIRNVREFVDSQDISPTGKRALFEARGDIFSIPEKEGNLVNLTRTQGVRELFPAWSPDGKWISYYSDRTGEYEIYLMNPDGGEIRPLTQDSRIWRFPPRWSPDSRMLVFSDKNQLLQVLDVASRQVTPIDRAVKSDITDYSWAPDSRWVVYTKEAESDQSSVWIYSLDQKKAFQLTDGEFNDFNPVFSPCGKYLFFLSNRDFNLAFSAYEFDYLYNRATRIYALPLTADAPPLMPDKNDVEAAKPAAPKETPAKGKAEETKKPTPDVQVKIDFGSVAGRVTALPLPAADYRAVEPIDNGFLYFRDGEIHLYKYEDKSDKTLIKEIGGATLSADRKKILYRARDQFGIIGLQPDQAKGAGLLNLVDMTMKIDPLKEWQQIFNDGWRIFRDWFYVKNLHGVDWAKMKEKYGRLVPHLAHRADLDFIFGELVGEVNAGHTYVNWGDFSRVKRIDTGLLGADLRADEKAGRYVIAKIYAGENWTENRRSPLTEQGIAVKEGDYLIALNGEEVTTADNPYRFLENCVGKKISIKVNGLPKAEGAREYRIKPIRSELDLFYLDWVQSRRAMVDRLSGGKIGYIHVPDTSANGNRELFRGVYSYQNKEALIIDDRYNGGGFIPGVMSDLLARKTLNYWVRRGLEMLPDPGVAHDGPKVMLINGYSSSGGDAFPYYFKKRKLGTLIGTRTWGGLIGISGNPGFVDGGSFNVPTFGFVDTEGNWAVEGEGVAPDIEVIDLPEAIAAGKDPGIEKAVEVLLKELQKNPPLKTKQPSAPDRSKWIEKEIK